jgi:hypothetical protein
MAKYWLGVLLEHVLFVEHGKGLLSLQKLHPKVLQKNVWNKVYEMHVFMFGDRAQVEKMQFAASTKWDFV